MIRLLGNRVLIEPIEEETANGFLIPEEYRSFRVGIVAAVGNGARLKNGQRKPIPLQVGARVLLSDDYRMPIELDHKQYFLVSDEKVLCVLCNASDFMKKNSDDWEEDTDGNLKITRMPTNE